MGLNFKAETIVKTKLLAGNNIIIKQKIERAISGGELKIEFFGASITKWCNGNRDQCYGNIVFHGMVEYIKQLASTKGEHFDPSKIKYINQGINGTSSVYGMFRVKRDILENNPDIVVIDYAVNDWKDLSHKQAFECMLRDLITYENPPAVIIVANIMKNGYTCQAYMKELAEYYKVPIIGIGEGLMPAINSEEIREDDFFFDYVHPTELGHKFIAESILYCIQSEYEREKDSYYEFPQKPIHGSLFQHMNFYTGADIPGEIQGFSEGNPDKEYGAFLERTTFSYRDSISFRVTCKSFFIIYMEGPVMDFGMAYVYLDGKLVEKLNGYNTTAWYNPNYRLITSGETKEHYIQIKMAQGDEKKVFKIYGVAFND